jgi:carboxylesterase
MAKLEKLLRTKASTRVIYEARPFRIDPPGAREAVLLLHGFTGIPSELSIVGTALAETGFAILGPRYPGHGTDRADFLASDAEDWLRCAIDSYLDLRADYDTVHVLGHSMGGLIATAVATIFDAPKLVLLAPAFELSQGFGLARLLGRFKPVIRRGRPLPETEASDPARRKLHADYWADDLLAGKIELARLFDACRHDLPRLRSKVLVIVGEADDVVPPIVADYIKGRARNVASFEARTIVNGGHLFPFDAHSAETATIVKAWFSKA